MSALLSIRGLTAGYGKIAAVHGIDIDVEQGQTVTIIGPNGAGKSTTLNSVMGLHPAQGRVFFDGADVSKLSAEQRLTRGLCLVAENRELFASMSVEDNVLLGGFTRRHDKPAFHGSVAEVYELFPRLYERRTQLAGTLSGGERQMLTLARAMMSRPQLLMLDEPSLGLAPKVIETVFDIITILRQRGVAILLIEQNARAALEVADRGYVMEVGSITLAGSGAELRADPRVVDAYLGVRKARKMQNSTK